jgi:lipid-A-disaccharide synthase
MARRVFITAAEASGDQHAAELAGALREMEPSIELGGIGGPKMAAAGVKLHHESVGRAAMGWRGALRAWEVSGWMRWTRRHYRQSPPDLHICVDSSAMNLPFARLAKSFGVPVLYYIAPQLWASREGRMKKLRRDVDALACILPFEEQYFRMHRVKATYVGHPLFDELPPGRAMARAGAGGAEGRPVIGLIPGSRRSEVKANLPAMLGVAIRISAKFRAAEFLAPTTEATHSVVSAMLAGTPVAVVERGFDQVVPRCDLCIVKSGTSTLHVAAYQCPMIVVYRMNPLLWHLAARWLIKTKKIALVNILAGNVDLVPEYVPWHGSVEAVANCAIDLLADPAKLAAQKEKLAELIRPLDRPGASRNAARMALELMESRRAEGTFP